jgi:tetratricopeptide (TPR) repeat protein
MGRLASVVTVVISVCTGCLTATPTKPSQVEPPSVAAEDLIAEAELEHTNQRHPEAKSAAMRAQAKLMRAGHTNSLPMLRALTIHGHAELAASHPEAAVPLLERAVTLARHLRAKATLEAAALWPLASAYTQTKRAGDAIPLLDRVQEIVQPGSVESNRLLLAANLVLWRAYQHLPDPAAIRKPLERIAALVDLPGAAGREPRLVLEALLTLARLKAGAQRPDEATALIERAGRLVDETPPLAGRRLLVITAKLAVLIKQGDATAALEVLTSAGAYVRVFHAAEGRFETLDLAQTVKEATAKPPAPPAGTSAAGASANAASVVATMRSEFRACYQVALDDDASTQGHILLSLRVGAEGKVQRVVAIVTGLRESTADCILQRAATGAFHPPTGGKATVQLPVTFVKQ